MQYLLHLEPGSHLMDTGAPVQASSPDEEALVQGASLLGFTLAARTHDKVLQLAAPEPSSPAPSCPAMQLSALSTWLRSSRSTQSAVGRSPETTPPVDRT